MSTTAALVQTIRHYGTRPLAKIAYVALASSIAVGSIASGQHLEARDAAVQQITDLRTDITTQLDMAADDMVLLSATLDDARELHATAAVDGALPADNSLDQLTAAVADAHVARYAYQSQARDSRAAQAAANDSHWLVRNLASEQTALSDAAGALRDARLVLPTHVRALDEAKTAVTGELAEKAAANKKAAKKKAKEQAEREAEEAAAAQSASEAQTYSDPGYHPDPAPTYQAPAHHAGGGRAAAEALAAQVGGASVEWIDLGVSGMTGAGRVDLFGSTSVIYLSSQTADEFWLTDAGRYVVLHEVVHHLTNVRIDRLWAADYTYGTIADAAETGADCGAAMLGAPGYAYGCDAAGQKLANILLG